MRKLTLCLAFIAIFFTGLQARADDQYSTAQFRAYMAISAQKWGIQEELILAVAETESSAKPWAINIKGKAYYPKSRNEAIDLIKRTLKEGKSFDVGVMQLNVYTLKRIGISPDVALDPYINILIGGWLLANELRRFGYTWQAIGNYHTPVKKNPERAKAYAQKVISNLGRDYEPYISSH